MTRSTLAGVLAFLLCTLLVFGTQSGPVLAQDTAPSEDAASTEEAAPEAAAPEEEPAPEEEAPPELPAPLTNPNVPVEELALRLIPLTADELNALADEWLGIVKSATQEVTDKQIEIQALEGEASQELLDELTDLTERRADLFERYSSVVDSLEKEGWRG